MNQFWSSEAPTLDPTTYERPSERPLAPLPGTIIGGMYRVVGHLGEGAMGVVLMARDEALERDVAIKLIHGDLLGGVHHRERFLTEARAMARVNHPNVLQIYAFGEHAKAPFFVMELVEGETLESWILKRRVAGSLPDLDASLRILERMCLGVQAIHDANTVHRDLKPSNVLLDAELRVRVGDLGVANVIRIGARFTKGELVGTPQYMAPEVCLEDDVAPELAPRADVYSLGCMAFELLTGRVPFQGQTIVATLVEHLTKTAVAPSSLRPELGPAFDAAILRALVKDPAARTPSADAFRLQLVAARDRRSEPVRILVAEDDADFREGLAVSLRDSFPNAEIETVADGEEALAAFDARHHSVAVIDLRMPKLDGMELVARLRARDAALRVPIIVLTGRGGAFEWRRLSAMGVDGFLVKPVNLSDVITLVRRALGDRSKSFPPPA